MKPSRNAVVRLAAVAVLAAGSVFATRPGAVHAAAGTSASIARNTAAPGPGPFLPLGLSGEDRGPYNVLLYVLDTVRADHWGLYGYVRDTTPYLETLAQEGIRWNDAHSASTWTWPSVVSILTSQTVYTHKSIERAMAIHPGWNTLPEILKNHGYTSTILLTSNPTLGLSGHTADHFDQVFEFIRPDQNLTDRLVSLLRNPTLRPFFIHAQPFAAHTPYVAPPPYDSLFVGDSYYGSLGDVPRINQGSCIGGIKQAAVIDSITSMDWYVAQYDALIAYMDDQIRQTMAVLEEEGLRENTIVVITSDHGEELAGDHDRYFCHWDHYEGNTHVPLLLLLPEEIQRRYGPYRDLALDGLVDHTDLLPTILEIAGIPVPPEAQGRSLVRVPEPPMQIGMDHVGRALREGDWKLVNRGILLEPDPARELFDLSTDPGEQQNLASIDTVTADAMEVRLLRYADGASRLRPPTEPSGVIFESDLEDSVWTEGRFALTTNSLTSGWEFYRIPGENNRVLRGYAAANAGAAASFQMDAACIAPPLHDYAAQARVRLLSGQMAFETLWMKWHRRGYRAEITADEVRLVRRDPDGTEIEWGRVAYPFGIDQWRLVRLETDGVRVALSIDGTRLITATEPEPGELWGTTFFGVASTGGEVYVDDIRIERP